jgi:hypothetical protein
MTTSRSSISNSRAMDGSAPVEADWGLKEPVDTVD